MRILIDITHPAYLHFYRHVITKLSKAGHVLCITGRDKDILRNLALEYKIDMKFFGAFPESLLGKIALLLKRKIWLYHIVREFKPDVMTACAGPFIALLGKLMNVPTVVFYDTENDSLSNMLTYPFATRICVPDCYLSKPVEREVRYAGYHSLAYLHRDLFSADSKVREELGVRPDEKYSIVRFVKWGAGHDWGYHGLTAAQKRQVIQTLLKYGKVFVTDESGLVDGIRQYKFPLPYFRVHDAIAFASLVFGESSTMCSEAAVLGVPSVFVYPRIKRGYTKEQSEKWEIVHWYTLDELTKAVVCAEEILKAKDVIHWKGIGEKIQKESINGTNFICAQIVEAHDDI
ncbi:MAG: hypothetical protein A3G33_02055 [Omnitrophica bacterium RIFCSPLOWO2_12_FULL_44_17]|uniref:DUF354 domain-containing protein n=1 Tax=Candidatus Danuiimicrobium aquiferis TaxID=1801832 RepID=A0A1G1KT86_9BACT|nr:MAG: hypothetical protein A3B72_04165 [Omnitrophica bacterium RIFCSPHIGHO2_02_FULL_45_28]OGW88639.1 MAG: hypothetical protein A3E74_03350 [Omnitrophica bacterium RIFCSPHIGHO2_12_FULL_44_12]OGW96120.1 MAG: hypothetical protein A3G33_02055 [Omnitrophica bacterium RIFCSPLOWO2_12_FULL_44_17]OGX04666.1 MAG: hypothetical protein A3J12_11525 [Omnitrophica bacterium RIFCSPLOWO2_02_FULL_44_11]